MTLRSALSELVRAFPGPPSGSIRDKAKSALRDAILFANSINHKGWPHMRRQGYASNGGGYDTGTIAITQNARTVTGTGTAWTAAMVGWWLVPTASEEEVYEVTAWASGTSLTIDRAYQGDTITAGNYTMFDPYAVLPYDVHKLQSLVIESGAGAVEYRDISQLRTLEPKPSLFADGNITVAGLGPPTSAARYNTGTCTLTKGSATVEFSGATLPQWIRNRHIRFGGEATVYKIASRTDDDTLVLDRAYGGTRIGSGRTYEIDPPGCLRLAIMVPQEDQFAFKVEYFAAPQDLVNDTDLVDGPDSFVRAVLNIAKAYLLPDALPWADMQEGEVGQWRTRIDGFQNRGEAGLRAAMEGNVAPEQHAVFRNAGRG